MEKLKKKPNNFEIWRMLPPGFNKFFFSIDKMPFISKQYPRKKVSLALKV
jgi:hypothetical protein